MAPLSSVDWAARLAECIAPLAGEGFPIAMWNVDAVARSFITTPGFIKSLNILTREGDVSIFGRLIHRGNAGDWWDAPGTCTPGQMYNFCMWLRSPDGAAYTEEQRQLRRLENKAFDGQTVEDVCYVTALSAQFEDFSVKMKATRAMMREMETREAAELLRATKADYTPASVYIPLDHTEIGMECYRLYVVDCARQGKDAAELSGQLLKNVRLLFCGEAEAMHKTEFMRDARRREEVRVWLEEKAMELESVGEAKLAKKYRFYLRTTGGEVTPRVRAEVVERAIASGSRTKRRCRRMRKEEEDEDGIVPAPRRQCVETVEEGRDDAVPPAPRLQGDPTARSKFGPSLA